MLRIKHENISMQMIALVTLCLCYGLTMYLFLAPAYAVPPPKQHYFVVDAYQTPGVVYRIQYRRSGVFFRRSSGNISSIVLCNGQLFFCSTNGNRIYLRTEQEERVVFTHNTYIRDIAVDSGGNLYFSEASGAGGDGRIYRLNPPVDQVGVDGFSLQSNQLFYTVELTEVDGFWAGDFTFDVHGDLYLSTGNRSPAFIYKFTRDEGCQYSSPRKIYKDIEGAIKGIAIEPNIEDPNNPNFIYYVDWKQTIHKLNLQYLRRSVEFSRNIAKSKNPHLSDIAFDVRIRR